jgi:hypothetical protein
MFSPWTTAGGAFFASDASSKASGSFKINAGKNYEANMHHAVVAHDSTTGAQLACGVLGKPKYHLMAELKSYSRSTLHPDVKGNAEVVFDDKQTTEMAIMYKTSKGASGCTTCYLWNSHPYRHYL